ncbi:MAG: hypothetical protein ISS16_08455 [Ignavibacteria bacterium]|nr:hypothetical protein [Ignavibacteria bacterium]
MTRQIMLYVGIIPSGGIPDSHLKCWEILITPPFPPAAGRYGGGRERESIGFSLNTLG